MNIEITPPAQKKSSIKIKPVVSGQNPELDLTKDAAAKKRAEDGDTTAKEKEDAAKKQQQDNGNKAQQPPVKPEKQDGRTQSSWYNLGAAVGNALTGLTNKAGTGSGTIANRGVKFALRSAVRAVGLGISVLDAVTLGNAKHDARAKKIVEWGGKAVWKPDEAVRGLFGSKDAQKIQAEYSSQQNSGNNTAAPDADRNDMVSSFSSSQGHDASLRNKVTHSNDNDNTVSQAATNRAPSSPESGPSGP